MSFCVVKNLVRPCLYNCHSTLYLFSLTLNIKTHDLSPNLSSPCIYTLAVSIYIIFIVKLIGERWFFLKDQRSPIIKKIQSSKSWYLKIALILSTENPLPRGVVVRTANTHPGGARIEPTMQHLQI